MEQVPLSEATALARDLSFFEYSSTCPTALTYLRKKRTRNESRAEHFWVINQDSDIRKFRVIAGMGPVPWKLRAKRYREIEAEDFGDYLGGPIFYNVEREYPKQFVVPGTILDFKDGRRSSKSFTCGAWNGAMLEKNIELSGEDSASWVGVVDIVLEEEPIAYRYHYLHESYAPLRTVNHIPYFQVTDGRLCLDIGNYDNPGHMVGNVACGRWFYKEVVDHNGEHHLVTWHESVDGNHEFLLVPNLPETDGPKSNKRVLPYAQQVWMREVYLNIVNHCLGSVDVPMDVSEFIRDYLFAHEDSAYWLNSKLPNGWMTHGYRPRNVLRIAGFCGTAKPKRYPGAAEDGLILFKGGSDSTMWTWENLWSNSIAVIGGIPGGCFRRYYDRPYYEDATWDSSFEFSFKFKGNEVHAGRLGRYK